jgi:hypothetical protein
LLNRRPLPAAPAAKTLTLASEPGKRYILTNLYKYFQEGIDYCDTSQNGATMVGGGAGRPAC